MYSRSKVPVAREVIAALVDHHLDSTASDIDELADGTYNAAYRVTLGDGRRAVVKVAPPDDLPRLCYEDSLMRSEVSFYDHAAAHAPVPAVLASDFSRHIVDRDVVILSFLEGQPLQRIGRKLAPEGLTAVRSQLGTAVARLHTVRGTTFGYERPSGDADLSGSTWGEAFHRMWEAAIADIVRYRIRAGVSPARLRATLDRHRGLLDGVTEPVRVHFDLWDGNVFAVQEDGSVRLSGIIDGERMFWGDPIAELVSSSLFRDPAKDEAFNHAYAREGGQRWTFDAGERTRLALYNSYLCLLMLAESAPRGYRGANAVLTQQYVRKTLRAAIRSLND